MSCVNVAHDGALNRGCKTNRNLMNALFFINQKWQLDNHKHLHKFLSTQLLVKFKTTW